MKRLPLLLLALCAPCARAQYALWRTASFTASELADAAISGDLADPNSDGIPNLIAYAFDITPTGMVTTADCAKLPTSGFVQADGSGWRTTRPTSGTWYFALRFTGAARTDIALRPEISADLVLWWPSDVLVRTTAAGVVPEVWRDLVPLANRPRCFGRVRTTVTTPAQPVRALRLLFNRRKT